jgi:hypothetical protein
MKRYLLILICFVGLFTLATQGQTLGQTLGQSSSFAADGYKPLKFKRLSFQFYPTFTGSRNKANILAETTKDKVFIDFVGTGDIQQAVSNGQPLNANTGAGIIFERYSGETKFFQSQEIEATINIATTADSIVAKLNNNNLVNRRDFGSYILNPQSAKQSIYLNSNLYFGFGDSGLFKALPSLFSGVNIRFIASNNLWQYDDTTTKNVGAYMFRIGVFHEFLPDNYRLDENNRAKFSLFLGFNYSLRGITGDLSSQPSDALRTLFLGTAKKSFGGFEINTGFRLNNLRLEFNMPVLSSKSGHVDGLTDTQFQFTIRFIGGFSLKINTTAQAKAEATNAAEQQVQDAQQKDH